MAGQPIRRVAQGTLSTQLFKVHLRFVNIDGLGQYMASATPGSKTCLCGSKKPYAQCCEPLHRGAAAATAEALMRSRYSAFALGLDEYIQRSWHSSKRPPLNEISDNEKPRWIGLQIKRHEQLDSDRAIVEFVARYKINGRAFVLHESSRFVRADGHWFYIDGITMPPHES